MKTSQQQQGPAKKRNYCKLERVPACVPNGGFGWMAWPLAAPPLETSTKSISRTLTEHRCTPWLHTSIYSLLRWWPLIVTEVQGEYKAENITKKKRKMSRLCSVDLCIKMNVVKMFKKTLVSSPKTSAQFLAKMDTDIRRRIRQTQHRLRLCVSFNQLSKMTSVFSQGSHWKAVIQCPFAGRWARGCITSQLCQVTVTLQPIFWMWNQKRFSTCYATDFFFYKII